MDKKLPQHSVYLIFNEDGDYMGAVSTKELKDKVIKGNGELKGFTEIKVNQNIDKWLK